MSSQEKIIIFLKHFGNYFFVFLFFFSIFYYIQFSFPYLEGVDAYYHIKHSYLIRTQGIESSVNNFSWLEHHFLKNRPGDFWLGYHLLLLPFTSGDLIFGAKLSTVFLAAFLFLTFYFILRRFEVRYPFIWTLILFFSSASFTWRLLLARPYVLSIIFAILGLYLILKKKYLWLFLLSLLYSFSVLEAPLILILAFLAILIEFLIARKFDFKLFFASFSGFLAGFIIRPDFPNNLYLIYHGVGSVMLFRLIGVNLNFGAELTQPFIGLMRHHFFLFLAFVIPFYYIILQLLQKQLRKKMKMAHIYLFVLSLLFAGITFGFSTRFSEYLAPISVLFAAIILTEITFMKAPAIIQGVKNYQNYSLPFIFPKLSEIYQKFYRLTRRAIFFFEEKRKTAKILTASLIFISLLYFTLLQIIILIPSNTRLVMLGIYQEAAEWLKNNTPPKSLVLNKPWSIFPYLFFYNHQNTYSFGMDPTLSYLKDPSLYWLWRNTTEKLQICDKEVCLEKNSKNNSPGEEEKVEIDTEKVYEIFKNRLKGDYIITDGYVHKKFEEKVIDKNEKFEKVFQKGTIKIYKIK